MCINEFGVWHPAQVRQGGADVDDPGVVVDISEVGNSDARENEWCPRLREVERPVLPDVAALVRERMARRMHDRDVRAALRIAEERDDPLRSIGIGVLEGVARTFRRELALIGQERHRILAGDGVLALEHLVPPVGVQADPTEVVRRHRDRSRLTLLHPEHEVDDGGQLRRDQSLDDRVA